MYAKVFRSIFDGSLYGQFEATIVFLAMLVIADRSGTVDMTVEKLAAECGYPIDIVREGIKQLEQPDPRSRTPDEDGRRITLLHEAGWGWQIVNYAKYRDIRSAEERREYFRVKKQEQRAKKNVHQCPPESTGKHLSDAESDAESYSEESKNKTHAPRAQSQFDEARKEYPRRGGGQRWADAERGYLKSLANGATHEEVLQGVRRYAAFVRAKGDEGGEYVQQAGTFFGRNEGWREAWTAPTLKRELSPIERVELANGGSLEKRDEWVVSEQRSGESVENIFGDVWSAPNAGLRRIGS